jgi:hypothetical protein
MTVYGAQSRLSFTSFGVDVCLESNDSELLDRFRLSLRVIFKDNLQIKPEGSSDHLIELLSETTPDRFSYSFQGEKHRFVGSEGELFHLLRTLVRVTVASNSPDYLFIHSGAVSWKGKGLILPAQSYAGKTSLVTQLCRLGAQYYSDEYAVIGRDGLLHPFPKALSIRGERGRQDRRDVEIDELDGTTGVSAVAVSLILFTRFEDGFDEWNPVALSTGDALLGLIPHMIAFPVNPEFCLKQGARLIEGARGFEAVRGEVTLFAPKVLELLD